ncbi:MAG TPA: hypothetical protein VFQ96_02510 [Microbacteriaceae bacterium]|nr:hypothetical protein [Microbacteriaceae bacterium]
MRLYRGTVVSASDPSVDIVFADETHDLVILRLRGGTREEMLGGRHAILRSTASRPDYVVTDDRGVTVAVRESIDYSANLPGTLEVIVPSPSRLNLAGILTLTSRSDPITITFSLQPL